MQLQVETGDVTSRTKATCAFRIEVLDVQTGIVLDLAGAIGRVQFADWPLLLEQIKTQELVKRHMPDMLQTPLRDLANVISRISSTPTFQLFLAGFDIAERIGLASGSPFESVLQRFKLLRYSMPSVTGAGGLFFVPDEVLHGFDSSVVDELVKNNKLCSATVSGTETLERFYIPYATPIGFVAGPVSKQAIGAWDTVRNLYYAFRQTQ